MNQEYIGQSPITKYLVKDLCLKKHFYYYAINSLIVLCFTPYLQYSSHVTAEYLVKKNDEKAEEINKFLYVLKEHWPSFTTAEEAVLIKKEQNL